MRDPIAYTYEADVHCPACTRARFGREITCASCRGSVPVPSYPDPDADRAHRYQYGHGITPRVWPWPPEDARDREGNPVGSIAPWDDWCDGEDGPCTLACGTCLGIITQHGPHDAGDDDYDHDDCDHGCVIGDPKCPLNAGGEE